MGDWEKSKKDIKAGKLDPFKRPDPAIQHTVFNRDEKDEDKYAFVTLGGEKGEWLSKRDYEIGTGAVSGVSPEGLKAKGSWDLSQKLKDPKVTGETGYDIAKARSEGKTDKQIMAEIQTLQEKELTAPDTDISTEPQIAPTGDIMAEGGIATAMDYVNAKYPVLIGTLNESDIKGMTPEELEWLNSKAEQLNTEGLSTFGKEEKIRDIKTKQWMAKYLLPLVSIIPGVGRKAKILLETSQGSSEIDSNFASLRTQIKSSLADVFEGREDPDVTRRKIMLAQNYISETRSLSKFQSGRDLSYWLDMGLSYFNEANVMQDLLDDLIIQLDQYESNQNLQRSILGGQQNGTSSNR